MVMTKKHFISLAEYIKYNKKHFPPEALVVLAAFCYEQNKNFDEYRWMEFIAGRCGPNGGKILPKEKPLFEVP